MDCPHLCCSPSAAVRRVLRDPTLWACKACGSTDGLWVCVACGHIGCGRYSGEHAKAHFHETGHAYSLELETQQRSCASFINAVARRLSW